jgi:hypothetical protein
MAWIGSLDQNRKSSPTFFVHRFTAEWSCGDATLV